MLYFPGTIPAANIWGLGPGDTLVSKVDVVPDLMELTVHRGAEADPGGTFAKLVFLLLALPSRLLLSPCVLALSSTPLLPALNLGGALLQQITDPPAPRASLSISLNELVLTVIPVGETGLRFFATALR